MDKYTPTPAQVDLYTGEITCVYNDEEWCLSKNGHKHKIEDFCYTTGDGRLVLNDKASTSGIIIYRENECKIKIDGQEYFALVRVGDFDGSSFVFASNRKLYLIDSWAWPYDIHKANEISFRTMSEYKRIVDNIQSKIGDFNKLDSRQTNLVNAFNELLTRIDTPRHMVGWATWLIMDFEDYEALSKMYHKDLEIVFSKVRNRWEYWSTMTESYIPLPRGWQKLNFIVRNQSSLNYENVPNIQHGDKIGVLEEEKVYEYDNQMLSETSAPKDEVGDEYVVQKAYENHMFKTGSLIYTQRGWIEILK